VSRRAAEAAGVQDSQATKAALLPVLQSSCSGPRRFSLEGTGATLRKLVASKARWTRSNRSRLRKTAASSFGRVEIAAADLFAWKQSGAVP
jgi:hypothetical protein